MPYVLILIGLIALFFGGDFLVKGAVGLAKKFGVSTLVIGLTVVSLGTSAPELLVSLKAALTGVPDIAIGNVVGSNIANLALVLGLSALIFPLAVNRNVARIDLPIMLLATLVLWYFMSDLLLTRKEGLMMFLLLILYTMFLFINSKKQKRSIDEKESDAKIYSIYASVGLVLAGSIALVFGADWLVTGASEVARESGISDHVIGVTIVAFGTSVPELVTSVVAALKKEADISIGNLVGSNIFNICAILGISSLVIDIPVNPVVLQSDIFWVLGISIIMFPFVLHKFKIHRFKAAILLSSYFIYLYIVF